VFRLPGYQHDRYEWRKKILERAQLAARTAGVIYSKKDHLEVVVLLYLNKGKRLIIHDVDNRLKDILDALQGRFGGAKADRSENRLIDNDRQVCRVVMEKQKIPKHLDATAGGKMLIRPFRPSRWPLQGTKGKRPLKALSAVASQPQ
jgi:hypothetical protein